MDIWAMVSQYVDPIALFIALLVAEIVRRYVPGAAEKGNVANRIMPFIPLVTGIVAMGVMTTQFYPVTWAMKGLVSGALAAYAYRAFKVVILGD